MNKIYKTIYNESLGTWVAVPEIAKSKGKKSSGVSGAASALGAFSSVFRLSGITLAVAMALGSQSAFAAQYNSITDASGSGVTSTGVTNKGIESIVIGVSNETQVLGDNKEGAVAIGWRATTGEAGKYNGGQVALGNAVHATGDQSIAIGNDTDVTGHSSIGIGGDDVYSASLSDKKINNILAAKAYHDLTGNDLHTSYSHTTVSGHVAIAIGVQSQATGHLTTVLGSKAAASDVAATALGIAANASGAGSIALGAASQSSAANAIAIGTGAQASGEKAISIGYKNQVGGVGASAIGDPNINGGADSHVQGNNNFIASDSNGILLFGNKNVVGGTVTYAADGSLESGNDGGAAISNSAAVGSNNNITRNNVFILGSGINTAADGTKLGETIQNSVYLGADSSGITGNKYQKTKNSNTDGTTKSAGTTTVTKATLNGITYGNFAGASKTANGIVTVGYSGGERRIQNVAAGLIDPLSTDAINGSQLYATNDVLGNLGNSVKNVLGGNATLNPNGSISMSNIGGTGKNTIDEAIQAAKTEVAAGTNIANVTKTTGTDGQAIYTVNAKGTTVSKGSAAVTVTAGTANANNVTDYAVDLSQATKTDIQKGVDAKTAVDTKGITFAGDTGTNVTRKLGETLNIIGEQTDATKLSDGNIGVVADGTDKLTIKLSKELTGLTSVQAGDTTIDNNGLTITNGPSVTKGGIDANNTKVTNVANGTAASDAVNVSQLTAQTAASKTTVIGAKQATVTSDVKADGHTEYTVSATKTTVAAATGSTDVTVAGGTDSGDGLLAYTVDLSTAAKDNIQKGVDAKTAVDKGINFGDGSASNKFNLGDTIAVTGDSNIISTATADGVQLKLANSVAIGDAASGHPVNINGNDGTITGLQNKTFDPNSITSGRAATEDQLKAVNETASKGWNLQANNDTASKVAPGDTVQFLNGKNISISRNGNNITVNTVDAPSFTSVTAGDTTINTNGVTINNGPSITKTGIDAASKPITNVASGGNTDTNAANIGDVKAAINTANTTLTNTGFNIAADKGSDDNVKLGEKVTFTDPDGNIVTTVSDNQIKLGLANKVTIGDSSASNPIIIDGTKGTISGLTTTLPTPAAAGQAAPTAAPNASNAATLGDVLNAGWNLQENGTAKDFVKPYDTVNFANGTGTTVAIDTNGTKSTIKINVDAQKLAESAQLPVVYTKADGTKVYKVGNDFFTNPNGTGAVSKSDVIASLQNADGSTTAPMTLSNVKSAMPYNIGDGSSSGVTDHQGNNEFIKHLTALDGPNNPADRATLRSAANLWDLQNLANTPMFFTGDTTSASKNTFGRKLSQEVKIVGGKTTAADLTDNNIGVVSNGSDTLTVKLAKDLTGLNSVTAGDTKMTSDGITINNGNASKQPVSLTKDGLDNGGNKIANVAAGTADTDAVNVKQLNDKISNITNAGSGGGFGLTDDKGNAVTQDLGKQLAVNGKNGITVTAQTGGKGLDIGLSNDVKIGDQNGNAGTVTIGSGDSSKPNVVINGGKGTISGLSDNLNKPAAAAAKQDAPTAADIANKGGNAATVNDVLNSGWNLQADGKPADFVQPYDTVNFVGTNGTKVTANKDASGRTTITIDSKGNSGAITNINNIIGGNNRGSNVKGPDGNTATDSKGDTVTVANALKTYNATLGDTVTDNTVLSAIKNINEQGTKYFHVNGGDAYVGKTTVKDSEQSQANGGKSVAIGYQTIANGKNSVAIGNKAKAKGKNSISIGNKAKAKGKNSISIGNRNIVEGNNSGAFGDPSYIYASNSYSVGNNNKVGISGDSTDGSFAIGNENKFNTSNTFVLGNQVTETKADSVFLGRKTASFDQANSTRDGSTGVHQAQGNVNSAYTYQAQNDAQVAGRNPVGIVSVGNATETRQIQGVGAGVISPTSTDAINGSQLYYTNKAIAGRVDGLSNRIDDVDGRARAGIASAMASAGLPQAYLPGKSMVAAAASVYRGEPAIAVGVSTISDNGKWIIKGTANANRKDAGVTVGVGYQW